MSAQDKTSRTLSAVTASSAVNSEPMTASRVAPLMSRSSIEPSARANSGLRNLASKKEDSSARMNLQARRFQRSRRHALEQYQIFDMVEYMM